MTELIEEIEKIALEVLKIKSIGAQDSPETIFEWDSFAQIVLFSMFSKKFEIKFQDQEILRFYNYGELVDFGKDKMQELNQLTISKFLEHWAVHTPNAIYCSQIDGEAVDFKLLHNLVSR